VTEVGEDQQAARDALKEIMDAFPKKRLAEFFGHFNEIDLYLIRHPPTEKAHPVDGLGPEEDS